MEKKELDKTIKEIAEETNSKFHLLFRTRWNITNMVTAALRKLARKINKKK